MQCVAVTPSADRQDNAAAAANKMGLYLRNLPAGFTSRGLVTDDRSMTSDEKIRIKRTITLNKHKHRFLYIIYIVSASLQERESKKMLTLNTCG